MRNYLLFLSLSLSIFLSHFSFALFISSSFCILPFSALQHLYTFYPHSTCYFYIFSFDYSLHHPTLLTRQDSSPFRSYRLTRYPAKDRAVIIACNQAPIHPVDPPQRSPRVSLPHVETQLNMHRYNGLFEPESPERQKENAIMESSTDSVTLHSSIHSNGSPNPTNGDTSTTEWSSAVGHAATGKSGRVIHNLQEDIARLTRECTLYRSRAEETQRMNDAFKTQVENMAERLRNLETANEMNLHSITRKDGKIEELRAEAQSEKDRRRRLEEQTNKAQQLMDEARDDFNRKCAGLQEVANHSRTQYDVLAKAGQRERAEQQKKFKSIRDDFLALKGQHEEKNLQLERLDTVMAQKNREIEVSRENFDRLYEDYEAYKKAQDDEVRTLIEKGRQGDARMEAALASLKETEGQMKWVIQVKKEIKDAE